MQGLLSLLVLGGAFWGGTAGAAAQDAVPIESLTAKATIAGVASIQSSSARLHPANNLIYTDYVLKFSDVWKGEPGDPYVLSKAGGKIGDRTVSLPGHEFSLKVGESIVVFAHPNNLGNNVIIGMHQGLFQIGNDSQQLVHRVLAPPSERNAPMTLLALKEQVFRASGRRWVAPPPAPAVPRETSKPYGSAAVAGPAVPSEPPRSQPPSSPAEPRGNLSGIIVAGLLIVAAALFILLRKFRAASSSSR